MCKLCKESGSGRRREVGAGVTVYKKYTSIDVNVEAYNEQMMYI